jgi:hypothetical protein
MIPCLRSCNPSGRCPSDNGRGIPAKDHTEISQFDYLQTLALIMILIAVQWKAAPFVDKDGPRALEVLLLAPILQ